MAQSAASEQSWDLEADVVVIGSGAAGLPAAIKAADGGASVLVVEANYDIGVGAPGAIAQSRQAAGLGDFEHHRASGGAEL